MKVTFDNVYNAFQIIAPKGTMISFTGEPTALADGVYLVGDDGIINLDEQFLTDTLYLSTEGTDYAVTGGMRVTYPLGDETVIIRAGSSTIPFSKGGKGGGGSSGDNTHYKGTTTTPISNGSTTNPITIDGESYTAVFGDIVVYGYTEFVFDGTQWSEFGRPFDTTPTSGSANAVTSDGIASLIKKGTGINSSVINNTVSNVASANNSLAVNTGTVASASGSFAAGNMTTASQPNMMAIGKYNSPRSNDLFNIGNGTSTSNRSNIVEVNSTEFNVNGDITKNGVSLPTPYTTMPTITASMLGQIAQYVGETTNDYVKGYFYIASSDGAAEPTYSWVSMVDSTPTSGSKNFVSSDGVYTNTAGKKYYSNDTLKGEIFNNYTNNKASGNYSHAEGFSTIASGQSSHAEGYIDTASGDYSHAEGARTTASGRYSHAEGYFTTASGENSHASGSYTNASQHSMTAIGKYNSPNNGDLFNIGNGTSGNARSNIVEVNSTELNVNGEIKKNGVSLPTPYTTMPTITASMLGQIAQYVGETTNDYVKGYFYIASSDGAAEPTYSWVSMVDDTPTSGSKNFVTSDGVWMNTAGKKIYSGTDLKGEIFNNATTASGQHSHAEGNNTTASGYAAHAEGGNSTASNSSAHAEGGYTIASGSASHAEGMSSVANGQYAHAEGYYTTASGANSHSGGSNTKATQPNMTAIGKYNSPNNGDLFNIGNGTSGNARSNIVEVNSTELNVNGIIQRDGIGIDDYTTTERKIGKWIDGSDLYQRTFEVTGLSKNTWNNSILDTSDIKIVDFTGLIYWLDNQAASDSTPLNYYASDSDNCFTCINTAQTDMRIYPTNTSSDMSIDKAIITIKYTKPSAQANLMQTAPTEEVLSETPTVEEDDMR